MKRLLALAVILLCGISAFAKDAKLTPEEIVAKHLESIGSRQALEANKVRDVAGPVKMDAIVGGGGIINGDADVFSDAARIKLAMKFNNPDYRQEQLIFDGTKVLVGTVQPGKRSALGEFVWLHQPIVSEGLLGGTLSGAWPLLNLSQRGAKLHYEGEKKVDGHELHVLTYRPKKGGDRLEVKLYFDAETYRHVRTVYEVVIPPQMAEGPNAMVENASKRDLRYVLTEDFSDFRQVNGLTLPMNYRIHFSKDTDERTTMWGWTVTFDKFNDQPISAAVK